MYNLRMPNTLPNPPNGSVIPPLHLAAQTGTLAWLRQHLTAKNVNAVDGQGRTPLHVAALAGQHEAVRILVEASSNVHLTDADGMTPLQYAARIPRLDSLIALVEAGADVNTCNASGFTPLHGAAEQGSLSKTRYLMENGANPEARLTENFNGFLAGFTPREIAVARGHANLARWIEKLIKIVSPHSP